MPSAWEQKALVRGDFVLSPNVPMVVAPGDEFEVSVGVSNNVAGSGANAKVNVQLQTSKHLQVLADASQTIKIGENHESVVRYKLKATQVLGSGNLTFTASLGGKSGKYSIDLSVRPAAPLYTTTQVGHLPPGGGGRSFRFRESSSPVSGVAGWHCAAAARAVAGTCAVSGKIPHTAAPNSRSARRCRR